MIFSNLKRRVAVILALVTSLGVLSCNEEKPEMTKLTIKGIELEVEVARTPEEKARGLMFREELKSADGMIFIFDEDRHLSFWMKNTLIPLSIAYISSDGRIREIYDMEPESLEPVVSNHSVRYALEVPRGYFREKGIVPGDPVLFEQSFER